MITCHSLYELSHFVIFLSFLVIFILDLVKRYLFVTGFIIIIIIIFSKKPKKSIYIRFVTLWKRNYYYKEFR